MGNSSDEIAPVAAKGAGAADCDWTELAGWIGQFCVVNSPCLPAALWVITSCASPSELFHPTDEERQLMGQLVAAADESQALLMALARDAEARQRPRDSSGLWTDLADVVKRLFRRCPQQFTVTLCFLCSFGKVLEPPAKPCPPTAAELEALLDELDRWCPQLVPGVLNIMTGHPHAGPVAARWQPPEKPREYVIASKLAAFMLRVLEMLLRADARADGLTAELVESFPQLPLCALDLSPEATLGNLPLETLLALEQVVDDECLSLPGKIGAIHRLLTGPGPVSH